MSWPWKRIRPPDGSSSLRMQRTSVDLPQPDSPTIPSVSPSRSEKETPSTAFTVAISFWNTIPRVIGKCFFRSSTTRSSFPFAAVLTTRAPAVNIATSFAASRAFVASSRWQACSCSVSLPAAMSCGSCCAADRHRERAARVEAASRRRVQERRRLAGDLVQALEVRVEPRQRAHQAPRVGVARLVEDRAHRPSLDDAGGVHHDHVVRRLRDDAEVVRDHDHGGAEIVLDPLEQGEDLRLRRHVERRRRLVGDDQVGVVDERHRDHHALAHAARELVRVVVDPALGAGDPDGLQQLEGAGVRLFVRHVVVQHHRLRQLASDLVHRVQRRHGVLEDHRDLVAANRAQTARRGLQEILAAEQHLARRGRELRVVEPHHGEARDALSRPRLAYDAEHLPGLDLEADPVDGLHDAVVRLELGPQVADVQEGLAHRAKLT